MGFDVERKFKIDFEKINKEDIVSSYIVKEGYIPTTKSSVVKITVIDNKGYLIVKGKNINLEDTEEEFTDILNVFKNEIPLSEAEEMLSKFCFKVKEKERFNVLIGKHIWEIDVLKGDGENIIIGDIDSSTIEDNEKITPS